MVIVFYCPWNVSRPTYVNPDIALGGNVSEKCDGRVRVAPKQSIQWRELKLASAAFTRTPVGLVLCPYQATRRNTSHLPLYHRVT